MNFTLMIRNFDKKGLRESPRTQNLFIDPSLSSFLPPYLLPSSLSLSFPSLLSPSQLEVARKYIEYHTEAFAFPEPNVNFIEGFIEGLEGAGLQEETFDIIMYGLIKAIATSMRCHPRLFPPPRILCSSNCVINLSPNKEAVLKETYRVLKVSYGFMSWLPSHISCTSCM